MGKKKDFVLLVKICELMKEKDYNLSKISLQQLVYILQQLYGVESSYEFKLYTYGPYSTELTVDLDELVSRNILFQEYCRGPVYYGSRLLPGENYRQVYSGDYRTYLEQHEEKIKQVIQLFGRYSARKLELRAALIYLYLKYGVEREKLQEEVRFIKPYFREEEIQEALLELEEFPEIKGKIKE